jgi:hypothetical protein
MRSVKTQSPESTHTGTQTAMRLDVGTPTLSIAEAHVARVWERLTRWRCVAPSIRTDGGWQWQWQRLREAETRSSLFVDDRAGLAMVSIASQV